MTKESARRKFLAPLVLGVIFILSRWLYARAGVRFDADTYTWVWHFIDAELLKHDLWRSIFYLHTQPPLMNLLTGVSLQLFPKTYGLVFQAVFLLGGFAMSLGIYVIGNRLGLPEYLSLLLAAWFSISPATVVYENQLFYTYSTTVLLVLSVVFLARFLEKKRGIDGLVFSLILALNALTWGLFHIFWLVICFGLVVVFLNKNRLKALWLLPAFFLVFALYTKNAILYGSFTSSTWAGLNVFKTVTFQIPENVLKQWAKDGVVSDLALYPPYRSAEVYLRFFPETPVTGIPLLDNFETSTGVRNQHHISYVYAGDRYMKDSVRILLHAPRYYLSIIPHTTYIYFHSASDYEYTLGIRRPIDELDTFWNRLFYGQWQKDEGLGERARRISPDHLAWWLLFGFLFVITATPVYLWRERESFDQVQYALVMFMLWNIVFVTAAGVLLDIGENNRTRFSIDPFLLLLTFFFLRRFLSKKRST